MSQFQQPTPRAWSVFFLPNPLPERSGYAHDDMVISLWLADLGINWLMAKEQRKVDRRDRRDQRRREKQVRHEIDRPVGRREAQEEVMVSEAAKAEARRIMAEALERAGMGGLIFQCSPRPARAVFSLPTTTS